MSKDEKSKPLVVALIQRIFFLDTSYRYPFYQEITLFLIYLFPISIGISSLALELISLGAETPGTEQYVFWSFAIGFVSSISLFFLLSNRYESRIEAMN